MSTSNCVKWDGIPLRTLLWREFVTINEDWWFSRDHMSDGTVVDGEPAQSFRWPTPIDRNMDCYKNPDGWINREVIYSFYNQDGTVNKEIVRLHYPDGTVMDGIEYHNVLVDSELPPGAIEMPKQDISSMFEEKVKQLQHGK